MKKVLLLFFIVINTLILADNEPKIGLVLGGGGGKGFFHIGVLKVLEEEKIPIDYISGTSIGAIIGGLYSLGYTANELEEIVDEIDWEKIFKDSPSRRDKPMEEKVFSERYAFSLPYKGLKFELPQGVLKGESIYLMLKKYTWEARGIKNFDNLPIPFRCVAGDLLTGEAKTFKSGDLAKVISASMAIPTIFTPVNVNNRLYCDGLIVRNLPVQDALDMGADKVIAVDVGTMDDNVEELSAIGILSHIVGFRGNDSTIEESKKAKQNGILIKSEEINDFSSTDYSKRKELIALGERTARKYIAELRKLKNEEKFEKRKSLVNEAKHMESRVYVSEVEIHGLKDIDEAVVYSFFNKKLPFFITSKELEDLIRSLNSTGYFKKIYYELVGEKLIITVEEQAQNNLRVGLNINNDDGASIIFNTDINNIGIKGFKTVLDIEASQTPRVSLQQFLYYGIKNLFGTILQAEYNVDEFDLYKNDDFKNRVYSLDVFFGTITKTTSMLGAGIRQDYNVYSISGKKNDDSEPVIYLYLKWKYDTFNESSFPNNGINMNLNYKYSLSDDETLKENYEIDGYKFSNLNSDFLMYSKLFSKKLSLITGMNYSYFTNERHTENDVLYNYYPRLGGIGRSSDSIEFYGLKRSSVLAEYATIYRLGFQYQLKDNMYLVYKTNFADYKDIDGNEKSIKGQGITLGMRTFFGPVDITLMNNVEEGGTIIHFNFGFRL